jgi:hypothetical protein
MADLPILFSAPMVRAILREIEQPGTGKTQTRRVLSNDKPMSLFNGQWADSYVLDPGNQSWRDRELRYTVGDRLYVREAWRVTKALDDVSPRNLDRTTIPEWLATDVELYEGRKRAAMHLPRWASRITLIVTDVRVQRLQVISNSDCLAEGIDPEEVDRRGMSEARLLFRELWDGISGERGYGWESNPWVAAYTFRPVLGNIDQVRP